jgi:6-phosphogluconolactonase
MTEVPTEDLWMFVGTYTRREPHVDGKSSGIHVLRFDVAAGRLSHASVISGVENPSYLDLHPSGKAIYAISEINEFEGRSAGAIASFSLDPQTNAISGLNQRSTKGPGPAYVSVDSIGRNVLVANYGGGSVTVLPVQPDLSLGGACDFVQHEGSSVNPHRQQAPHAHSIVLDAANRYALAADLGMDRILIYQYDAESGTLSPNPDQPWARTRSGAGPRHIAFHPSQRFVYVINELDSTIAAFRFDAEKGAMVEVQTVSTLPDGFDERSYAADIHVHPSGRFVYGSNRGHDSIAIFAIDEGSGELSTIGFVPTGGSVPRGFALDPAGSFALVANQNSDNIVVFAVDVESGYLEPTGEIAGVPTPVCIKMLA